VEEVGQESKETEPACEDDELIFLVKLLEELLLIFLQWLAVVYQCRKINCHTSGSDSFTGCRSPFADDI
jgi:hypothetical protein